MRIAFLADIHSNLHALRNALSLLRFWRPDMVACAGDIVGYCAFPNECCALVEDECDMVISGNHDRAALSGDTSRMNPYAARASAWTRDVLDDRSRGFLGSLEASARFVADGPSVLMVHGSPRDQDEYVHEDSVDGRMLSQAEADIVVMGHTHVPYVRRLEQGVVLNPGSVGQPRDGDPRGSFAVLDTGTLEGGIVRFDYPADEAAEAVVSAGLPRVLADRLRSGR